MTKLSDPRFIELIDYLEAHEDDIADEINDFYLLYDIFIEVFGRKPRSNINE
jgi:hypothetical protein